MERSTHAAISSTGLEGRVKSQINLRRESLRQQTQFLRREMWRGKSRAEIRPAYFNIPLNRYGIRSGYYRAVDIVPLLRRHRGKAKTILYFARSVGRTR